MVGRNNSVGKAILYGLDDPGIEIFRTRPDRPWGLTILLHNAGGKVARA
jgi:hypothetical protein